MTVFAAPGSIFVAELLGAPAGLVGQLGLRIDRDGTIVLARSVDAIAPGPATGQYLATRTAPLDAGSYLLVWDTGGLQPQTATETLVVALVDAHDGVVPDLDEVARLTGAYTRQWVGGYSPDGEAPAGREQSAFDESTTPTRAQVEGFIASAVREVAGRVGVGELQPQHVGLARTAATYHAAAAVEAKRRPDTTDEANSSYAAFLSDYRACLNELISQARAWVPEFR